MEMDEFCPENFDEIEFWVTKEKRELEKEAKNGKKKSPPIHSAGRSQMYVRLRNGAAARVNQ